MLLKISITGDDITIGKAFDCGKCPVALGLERLLIIPPRVTQSCISLIDLTWQPLGTLLYEAVTPETASKFIKNFDLAADHIRHADTTCLKPFIFYWEVPAKFVKRTVIIEQEIARLADLRNQMVGQLYPAILDDEIAKLRAEYWAIRSYKGDTL